MDAMAGNVAFIHADDNNPKTRPLKIVTASVDKIKLLNSLNEDIQMQDLKMSGTVSWVGRSSLEIDVDLYLKCGGVFKKLIESTFCMVAIDDITKKSAHVNPLIPETQEEKEKFLQGEDNKVRRSNERKQSLLTSPPTEEERRILHDLFMNPSNLDLSSAVTMKNTHFETLEFCQPTMKNLHNTIFGGYIMRKAYGLAFSASFMFFKECPHFVSLDEITFVKPVKIWFLLPLGSCWGFFKFESNCCLHEWNLCTC
jgi:acyl-coenzyme A thioesterase 9